ncbi:hypothetical protein F5X98DRAFT_312990 [Xylaria grammica]|nr:hypothetical protein F5X98DRAFT_312990 [Xylaria grammica]
MSHSTSNEQPPPLPPRSPRPPVTESFAPPPPGLPPRTSAVPLGPVGPPPPLPPRPSGYESRTPSGSTTPLAHPPSTTYFQSSSATQATSHFPLPPPPPLGPPPPYTASAADSPYHQPYPEKPTAPDASNHSFSSSPVSGLSSPTWTRLPPPPPGPPPQPSPHLSPGIPEHSPSSSRPLSPNGAPVVLPASQPSPNPNKHQDDTLGISQTHNNNFQAPTPSDGKPYTHQPPTTTLGPSPGTSTTSHSEKPSLEEHHASTPLSGAPLNQEPNSKTTPSHGNSDTVSPRISLSTQHPPLEASFQSLQISSVPPIPPKAPLAPSIAQNYPGESAASASGPHSSYSHSMYQTQAHPNHNPLGSTGSPIPTPQPALVNHPAPPQNPLPQAHPTSQRRPAPRAVTSCIDIPMTFSTDWYWHPEAAEYLICSRCYVDNIHASKYQDDFQSARFSDGKPRICRFSKPRMRDYLYKEALVSGSLRAALDWMQKRSAIPDCKGVDGVKGASARGITWYTARSNEIPNFLSCQACYEDKLMTNQFVHHFSVHTESQPADALWACDMPIPFIEREYEEKGKNDDWQGFVVEAKARLAAQPCPQGKRVVPYGRNWFVPKAGPQGLVLCAMCYCDHVIHSGEESKWQIAQGLTRSADHRVSCARGVFNIRILMAQAHEKKDFALFWNTVDKLDREKACDDGGIVDGVWYTLPSDPKEFGVCGACHVGILEPLGVARFWVRKPGVPPGAKLHCCFNIAHPKLSKFVPRLLEMYFTLDPTALDEYASVYAAIPQCPRDEDNPNRHWYGWKDCTICPECYLDYARHSPLDKIMELRDATLAENQMCEMYSPRMRKLYAECGSTNPPNLKRLLEHSAQRRRVYAETVPQIRMILSQQRMALEQQKFLNTMSTHYNVAGQLEQITYGTPHLYSAPGVGSGFANMNALQGAAYGQQAMGVAAGIGGGHILAVQQLEHRWRAVE